jgi:chromosomal replication initiation ATPase DnaA
MSELQKQYRELKRIKNNKRERDRYWKRKGEGIFKVKKPRAQQIKRTPKPNNYEEMVRIAEVISGETKISIEDIKGKSRKREKNYARQCFMYFTKDLCTQEFVAEYLSNRDHSTINNGINSIQDQVDTDPRFKAKIDLMRRKINGEVIEAKQPVEMQYNWIVFNEVKSFR